LTGSIKSKVTMDYYFQKWTALDQPFNSPKFWRRVCNAMTRQPIELESCSNHLWN